MQPVSDIEIPVIEPELAPRRPREPGIIQHPYTTSKSEGSMHVTERIKALWAVIEVAVEEAIIAAETIFGPKTGQEKKEFVVSKVLDLLRKLEEKQDILPSALEGVVFTSLEWALDFVVERVFNRLVASGVLHSAEGASA